MRTGRRAGDEISDSWRLGPAAAVIEVGVEAGGTDHGVKVLDGTLVTVLENRFQHAANLAFTAFEQAGGMGMAVDRSAVGNFVDSGDGAGAGPANEVAFDRVTMGMRANDATARVTIEIGRQNG